MAVRVQLNPQGIGQVMGLPQVRQALRAQAMLIAPRARQIAAAEQVDTEITVTDGTRPRGRSYSRVSSTNVAAEFGAGKTARRRILGRAADIAGG